MTLTKKESSSTNLNLMREQAEKHFADLSSKERRERDHKMEERVIQWIMHVAGDTIHPRDIEHYVADGCVLSKVMHNIVFNSIPTEDIDAAWGSQPQLQRINELLGEMRRMGIAEEDLFKPDDLIHMRNVPKVTLCLCKLIQKAEADPGNLLHAKGGKAA